MQPKPSHLGLKYAEQFKDTSIVEVYHHREPYVPETIRHLAELIRDTPRIKNDAGCGLGDLARLLVTGIEAVERVDAVDFSEPMVEKGKRMPGGDDPRLRWICGAIEEVALQPPYALIVAGDSVHWMEWEMVFPRFQQILTVQGSLAIVGRGTTANPWDEDVRALCARYSTNQEYAPYNLIEELVISVGNRLYEFMEVPPMNEAHQMHTDLLHTLLPIIPRTAYQDIRRLKTLVWAIVGLCLTRTVRSRCLG
jgi:trans-aconitate methyltransferase